MGGLTQPPTAIIQSPVPIRVPGPDSPGVGHLEGTASPHLAGGAAGAAYVAFLGPGQHHPERPRLTFVVAAAGAAAQPLVVARAAQAHLSAAVLPAGLPKPVPLL